RLGGTQTQKIDVRVVTATNVDLEQAVANGTFRRDLYYRLNVYPVRIPPLRERNEDISLLATHLFKRFSAVHGKRLAGLTDRALNALNSHDWPG
ncbi:sigma 54-interacting transcriptional regulator, partial [Acinetobacter baumannii]